MIFDQKLETNLIAGLLKRPNEYLTIQSFFSEADIYSEDSLLRRTILSLIRQAVEKGEGDSIDAMIVAQRLETLGIKFDEDIPVGQFVESLALRNIPEGSVYKAAVELKKLSERRKLLKAMADASEKLKQLPRSASLTEIQDVVDKDVNSKMGAIDSGEDEAVNIYDSMQEFIETDPEVSDELFGPFEKVNKIYGSLVNPGNIITVTSRSGSGKTTLAMEYCSYVGAKYDIHVLHFDNGEMSMQELQQRQVAMHSGVPMYLLRQQKWRHAGPEIVEKVRKVWGDIKKKKYKFFYKSVAGMSADEMVAYAKKFYYSTVGRGNKMIISFDYIKTTSQLGGNLTEWQVVGEIVDKFKKFVQRDIVFDKKPMISLFTSVQSNRSGITNNKSSDEIIDNESTVSLSDRIIQFSSHMFILRKKTMDEILEEGIEFGTHKFICIKARHLGEDVMGHLEPVKDGDKLRQNFINLEIKNFLVSEKGDLRDIVAKRGYTLEKSHSNEPTSF